MADTAVGPTAADTASGGQVAGQEALYPELDCSRDTEVRERLTKVCCGLSADSASREVQDILNAVGAFSVLLPDGQGNVRVYRLRDPDAPAPQQVRCAQGRAQR